MFLKPAKIIKVYMLLQILLSITVYTQFEL